ncbi:MAG: polysaccharide pyruvyl transferase family protein [Eubacterium sp.]|nr:polysaccharide pyruvyl transferase family protein [Eubacterium sp.]
MKKIGLFGLTFQSGNKGCSALAYSFLEILFRCVKEEVQIIVFSYLQNEKIVGYEEKLNIVIQPFSLNGIKNISNLNHQIKECDIVFDFTEGDSFSDIYGIKRAVKVSLTKEMTIRNNVPLVLGPQTYGPYRNFLIKKWAKRIVNKSNYACARDMTSSERMEKITKKKMDYFTDIAFALPPDDKNYQMSSRKKIGINVSSLLMNGGYTGDNQFGLKVDYSQYIESLIERVLEMEEYEIHLIPHVISAVYDSVENDFKACNILKEKYPEIVVAPPFDTPMEAKRYMSEMDVFTGARMHATIGAFSMKVPTIPFSYSPKFEGLFDSLKYNYVIHGKTMSTKEAVDKTIELIQNKNELLEKQKISLEIIDNKLNMLYDKISKILEMV